MPVKVLDASTTLVNLNMGGGLGSVPFPLSVVFPSGGEEERLEAGRCFVWPLCALLFLPRIQSRTAVQVGEPWEASGWEKGLKHERCSTQRGGERR